ncbi:putative bifunctional diguanylate cyclase/phosphodiesterase [Methylobacterium organophilum]|uniref:Diguanylate cyclase/phosphodiesterase n=1 Tax=Methylobacterium organophilum TaxID=410 RepID=A0ABQ4T6M4_METOR|nr:EAL domain-containing protein [Methylobacterium organophilum]GJE25900.1 hypothetical protein LKMONMHP_0743 [Methylobacterium organophilum]
MSKTTLGHRLLSGLRAPRPGDRIAAQQLAGLQKQVQSLYALLCINALVLAFTHRDVAPTMLTLWVPVALVMFCGLRAFKWWRLRPETLTEAEAVRHLRHTSLLSVVMALAFVSWALLLDVYGGPYERSHVTIFAAVTIMACIFCLTHLPVAAFAATGIVVSIYLIHCFASENEVFIAMGLNIAFVTAVMVRVLTTNFLVFIRLIESQAETQRLLEENAHLAHTDSLTGLPNRRFFFQRLDTLIAASARDGSTFALAIFDLDRFKPINDTYGHNIGDRVLAETGRRLATFAGPEAIVTRLGGDEFGLLLRKCGSAAQVTGFCNRICEALHAPIRLGEIQVFTGCSGGLALYPSGGRQADALFDRADYALYHSKEHQRGVTTLFSHEHEDAIRAERAVETTLQSADLEAEMSVHYQPILDAANGTVALVEGLARWTSPSLGPVPPDRFIAAAERCGMIHTLTTLLLRKALREAARLPPGVGLSFNLSSQDLVSPETVLAILAIVRNSGIDPQRLTLELTETAVMGDFERARQSIATLRTLGIKIALDDFGTGYSSLGYVHRLPLDKIKIDRSFMADLDSELGRSVVTTIIDLCQNLGVDGIAEGIETQDQFQAVRRYGCRYIQGYLIGAPMPIDALLERIEAITAAPPQRAALGGVL